MPEQLLLEPPPRPAVAQELVVGARPSLCGLLSAAWLGLRFGMEMAGYQAEVKLYGTFITTMYLGTDDTT